ncbi:DUF6101 family protein [uncultured Cohaesibacter sp.]|uniref:DUF6101 family protein n=1 Tax=uncultured Cohaesibacter sp. TaxID=1002546 RepID=UPI00292D466C|nr:DUF6101 family protein [uncultured Cohaesibacter sp.]
MRRQEQHNYTKAISYQVEGAARVDPHNIAKYFRSADIRSKAAELSGFSETALFGAQVPGIVQIKNDQLLVECHLSCGLPLLVRVPLSYYKGIGARFLVGKREGNPVICILELVHDDPSLTVPLMVTTDLEDAAIDWKAWSNRYGLRLLHHPLGADGYEPALVEGYALYNARSETVKPRRHHAQFALRRPRFLTRRKVGHRGELPKLSGREIIARN